MPLCISLYILFLFFFSYFTWHFISASVYLFFSGCACVHVCFCLTESVFLYFCFSLSLLLLIPMLISLFQSLSPFVTLSPHISVSHHGSLSPPFSISPWIFSPLPFSHLSHGRSPFGPGLRQRRTCWGGTRGRRVHCRSPPTPLRYSRIGALWAVGLGRRASDQPLWLGREPLREAGHTHTPEVTIR